MSSHARKARHSVSRSRRRAAASAPLISAQNRRPGGAIPTPALAASVATLTSKAADAATARALAPAAARPRARSRAQARGSWLAGARGALARLIAALVAGAWGIFYRVSMLLIAAGLVWVIWRIQEVTGTGGTDEFSGPWWQMGLRWLELLWLAPAPLAVALWAGWLIWAEAARRTPAPRPAPEVAVLVDGPAIARMPAKLVFRFVTRGEQIETLRSSIEAARAAVRAMPAPEGARRPDEPAPYRIDVVTDEPLPELAAPDCRIYVAPDNYHTPNRSRFKARALTFLQEASPPAGDEWRLYLDEESRVDAGVVAGAYAFIARAERATRAGGPEAPRRIGQGAIIYQGASAFFRAADALRTGDDLGRFRFQYGLGAPIFGAHGSFLLVRGMDERTLTFDVGSRNSITEDAAWALHAWARGWRFGWVAGYLREQPPQRVMDFVRQRARWLTGVRLVASDRSIPARYRMTLLVFTILWQLSFVPLLVMLAALATHTPPVAWMRLPADITWASFMLAYLQGLDTQARRVARERASPGPRWLRPLWLLWARAREWPMALGIFWYSLLEMFAVVFSIRREHGFFVIQKPALTPEGIAVDEEALTTQGGLNA